MNKECEYCEVIYYINPAERRFGNSFKKDMQYDGEVQLSWVMDRGVKSDYRLYVNDDVAVTDISLPVNFCPICGKKLTS